jgi:non-lysosomal glucosylceramidase
VAQGVECIESVRTRYDGDRRNPWDEPECGHHYARAMSSWSGILALSGFEYHGGRQELAIAPRWKAADFTCFWATGSGWGVFARKQDGKQVRIEATVRHGELAVRSCRGAKGERTVHVLLDGARIELGQQPVTVREGHRLTMELEVT